MTFSKVKDLETKVGLYEALLHKVQGRLEPDEYASFQEALGAVCYFRAFPTTVVDIWARTHRAGSHHPAPFAQVPQKTTRAFDRATRMRILTDPVVKRCQRISIPCTSTGPQVQLVSRIMLHEANSYRVHGTGLGSVMDTYCSRRTWL